MKARQADIHHTKMTDQPYVFNLGKGFEGEVPLGNFALKRSDGVRIHLDVVGDQYLVTRCDGPRDNTSEWFYKIPNALRKMADLLE